MKLACLELLIAALVVVATRALDPGLALPLAVAALIVQTALLVYAMTGVRSSLLERTLWRGPDSTETRVALSFDDGPDPETTPHVLAVLREHGVRATFFVVGARVREHGDIVRLLLADGHEIGCHADTHLRRTPFFGPTRMRAEIKASLDAIHAAAGVTPRLYRPPMLIRSPAHAGVVRSCGMVLIGMAHRPHDQGADVDATRLASRVVRSARGGHVIGLHDGAEPGRSPSRRPAVEALDGIVRGLRAKGLEPVTVGALTGERSYVETPDRGWTGRSRGGRLGPLFFDVLVRIGATRVAAPSLVVVAAWFTLFSPRGRRASIDLRRHLHGRGSPIAEWWWTFRHFRVFARTLFGRMQLLRAADSGAAPIYDGFEAVESVVLGERGFLMLSAHFGDWVLAGRRLELREREIVVVAARGTGLGVHQVSADGSQRRFSVLDVEGTPEVLATGIAAALRRGAAVAMLADRTLDGAGIEVPFLGGTARFPAGPFVVASVTGAPVIVVFAVPEGRGVIHLILRGPLRVVRAAGESRDAAIHRAVAQFAALLEREVRRRPFAWANFYPFWSTE